jgi:hypothetical protein
MNVSTSNIHICNYSERKISGKKREGSQKIGCPIEGSE